MSSKVCCLFNFAAHYRQPIYTLIDKQFPCDFFIGNQTHTPIQRMDYNVLSGFKCELEYRKVFMKFYYLKGSRKALFKRYDFYVLTGDPFCLSNWLILLSSIFFKSKTVLWTHGWYGKETKYRRVVKKAFFNLADKILLYGNYAKQLMVKEGIPEAKMTCIYNSLDYSHQKSLRDQLSRSDLFEKYFRNSDPTLIYIGRIQKVKRIDLILLAMDVLRSKNIFVNLVIVGPDDGGQPLQPVIHALDLERRVWMFGACYDESIVAPLLYNASVCVSPGNVGLTAIHAATYGTPTITHSNFSQQMPEFEVIEPGVTGEFFIENDAVDLARVINLLISQTEEARENVRKACYKIIDDKYNPFYQLKVLKSIIG